MTACARAGQPDEATKLLDEMLRASVEPTLVTFNTVMDAMQRGGRWEKTLNLLQRMRDRGLAPDEASYGMAIVACRKTARGARAAALIDAMVREAHTLATAADGRAGGVRSGSGARRGQQAVADARQR